MSSQYSPSRKLAPIALVVFAFIFFAIVIGSLAGGGGDDKPATVVEKPKKKKKKKTTTTGTETTTTGTTTTDSDRVYAVGPDDTLETISEATGISVDELEALNPDVDPTALVEGQQIKLQ